MTLQHIEHNHHLSPRRSLYCCSGPTTSYATFNAILSPPPLLLPLQYPAIISPSLLLTQLTPLHLCRRRCTSATFIVEGPITSTTVGPICTLITITGPSHRRARLAPTCTINDGGVDCVNASSSEGGGGGSVTSFAVKVELHQQRKRWWWMGCSSSDRHGGINHVGWWA